MPLTPEDGEPREDDAPPLDAPLEGDDAPATEESFDLPIALEPEGELDDGAALDLDPGILLEEEEEGFGEPEGPGVDIGALVRALPSDDEEGEPDQTGPIGDDATSDIQETAELEGDDGEGATERLEELVSSDLPGLGADGDDQEAAGEEPVTLLVLEDEEDLPPRAELGWTEVPGPDPLPACTTVRVERSQAGVLAGGSLLFTVDDAGVPVVLAGELDDPVTSLVRTTDGSVVFTTRGGELCRAGGGRAHAEQLVAFRDAAADETPGERELALGGPTPSPRPALLLHVKSERGTLLESTDQGTTWRRVELGGRVVALSSGEPPVCLVDTGRALRFFVSEATGGFTAVGSPWTSDTDGLSIATHGEVVAVLEAGRGVSVSPGRGAPFHAVKSSARATAVTAGRLGTRPSAFAALLEPASGRTSLLWIDAASADAFVVATLEPSGEDDPDDFCRVSTLAWEPGTETLWAGGAFGLRRFRRPPSA